MFAVTQNGFPKSTLTRPNNTTAYTQHNLIASSTVAGSIVVPSFALARDECDSVEVCNAILRTNIPSGFTTFQGHIDLWSVPPTFTNGDGGAFAVAAGFSGWLGHLTTAPSDAYSVSAAGAALFASVGDTFLDGYSTEHIWLPHSPHGLIYWTLMEVDSTGFTPIANQTFTLELHLRQY